MSFKQFVGSPYMGLIALVLLVGALIALYMLIQVQDDSTKDVVKQTAKTVRIPTKSTVSSSKEQVMPIATEGSETIIHPGAKNCNPGCMKFTSGYDSRSKEYSHQWYCSRKSMFNGGPKNTMCPRSDSMSANPTCCTYDSQCDGCDLT